MEFKCTNSNREIVLESKLNHRNFFFDVKNKNMKNMKNAKNKFRNEKI